MKEKITSFTLPIQSDQYFPEFITGHLQAYCDQAKDYEIPSNIMEKLESLCDTLIETVSYYFMGDMEQVQTSFNQVMDIVDISKFKHYEADDVLFRCRSMQATPISKYELFHVPMEARYYCKSSRYGVAGYPCLYLSSSVKLCTKELKVRRVDHAEYETDFANLYVAAFKPRMDKLDIIDFTENWSSIINRSERDPEALLNYPLHFMCSLRIKRGNDFIPEYIVPQLLLQYLKKKYEGKHDRILGIRYLPCYSDPILEDIGVSYNYVFPLDYQSGLQAQGYSSRLEEGFKWTQPKAVREYKTFIDIEDALVKLV